MKKMLLATLLATLAGLSQAVTINWRADEINFCSGTSTTMVVLVVKGTKAEALATVSNWYFAVSSSNIGDIKVGSVSGTSANADDNLRTTMVFSNNGSSWGSKHSLSATGTAAQGSTTFNSNGTDWQNAGSPDPVSLVFFDLGPTTADGYNAAGGVHKDMVYAYQIDNVATTLTGASVAINVGKVNLVPEPTVLALLAMGVAGLALRRRV